MDQRQFWRCGTGYAGRVNGGNLVAAHVDIANPFNDPFVQTAANGSCCEVGRNSDAPLPASNTWLE
jgi:hypothetical protein